MSENPRATHSVDVSEKRTVCNTSFVIPQKYQTSALLSSSKHGPFSVKCNWCMVRDVTHENRCYIPHMTNDTINGETNPDILVFTSTASGFFCGWCCALSMCHQVSPHLTNAVYVEAYKHGVKSLKLVPDPRNVLNTFVPDSSVTPTKFANLVKNIHKGRASASVQHSNMASSITLLNILNDSDIEHDRCVSSSEAAMANKITHLLQP